MELKYYNCYAFMVKQALSPFIHTAIRLEFNKTSPFALYPFTRNCFPPFRLVTTRRAHTNLVWFRNTEELCDWWLPC